MQRRLTFAISILALALLGSNCTFVASSNTGHANKEKQPDGQTDGGLLIVVSDGDVGGGQVAALRSSSASRSRSSPTPVDESASEELAPSGVPVLTPLGTALVIGALGGPGYFALRRHSRHRGGA